MKQHTLKNSYRFEGKGLHSGKFAHLFIKPAAEDTGIVFVRTDLGGLKVPAIATNVCATSRSTEISADIASVCTIEHIMSAFTGMGIDNAIVEIDSVEMPILDGSARLYAEAFAKDGLVEQNAERRYVEVRESMEIKDEKSGSWIRITPSDKFSIEATLDFDSKVLGVQKVTWTEGDDYLDAVAPCRTFCFFHEIEFLASQGLVKGGDVDNAIVVVEYPASAQQVSAVSRLFNKKAVEVKDGYLNNIELRFLDECGRHKLLDFLGDIRLVGGFPKFRVEAFKPGHKLNTIAAKAVINQ